MMFDEKCPLEMEAAIFIFFILEKTCFNIDKGTLYSHPSSINLSHMNTAYIAYRAYGYTLLFGNHFVFFAHFGSCNHV